MSIDTSVIEGLKVLVAKIIEIDASKIDFETSFQDLGADSMMLLEIVVAIEKKYKVEIPESDLPKMTNLNEIINVIEPLIENGT